MSNVEEFLDEDAHVPQSDDGKPASYGQDLYKKWFRSKTQNGFVSIKPWLDALKLKIDIGKTSSDGKLISSTNVFVDAIDFGAYLRSLTNGTGPHNFPANDRSGIPTAEGFASYGGAIIEGKPVSRIFKAHYWQNNDTYDENAFAWKCGHFAARKSDSGAFIPDMKSPISVDLIKVTRQDICSISYLVDLAMISHVTQTREWYNA
jgi:hypothetical protein